jgi:hypothetical protein
VEDTVPEEEAEEEKKPAKAKAKAKAGLRMSEDVQRMLETGCTLCIRRISWRWAVSACQCWKGIGGSQNLGSDRLRLLEKQRQKPRRRDIDGKGRFTAPQLCHCRYS